MIGRPKVPLVLTTPEQQALDSLAHRARTAPQVARRARIVLACARGLDNQTVAKKLRVSPQMVGRWRARFVTRRVDGLLDEPRPGAPRTITDDTVEAVIVRTLETTPDGATHWSTRTTGEGDRPESRDDRPHLAGLWPAAASHEDLHAVARPVAGREGARCRRAVSPPARSCPGAVCR